MTFARSLAPCLLLLLALGIADAPASADTSATSPEAASKFVQDLGNRAVQLFSSYTPAEAAKNEAEFRQIFREGFDFQLIGRFVLGRFWHTATPQQQEEYRKLFEAWVLDTYTRRIGAYRGETFKITGAETIQDNDALVETEIVRNDAPPIKAGWRVRNVDGQMKIIDVMVEGVSMALTQREEFASVIQNKGLDGLLAELKSRLDKLKQASSNG